MSGGAAGGGAATGGAALAPLSLEAEDPPLGIIFETPEDILKNIDKIKAQVIDSDIMPPGNLTGITESERKKISLWIELGAEINN